MVEALKRSFRRSFLNVITLQRFNVAAGKSGALLYIIDVVGADGKLAVGHSVELSHRNDHGRGKMLIRFCEDSNRAPQIAT